MSDLLWSIAVKITKRSSKQCSHGQNESFWCTRKRSYQNNTSEITAEVFCSQHTDPALMKTSTDNSHWQTMRHSDDRISWNLYTSGKAYGNLVLQATLPGAKKLRVWLVLFLENVLPLQR